MADTKITALTALTAADPSTDVLPIVDTSDTTMAASGTTKKISINNILGASATATLASATISGDLTVDTSTLKVDSANDRVGIGLAAGINAKLHVSSTGSVHINQRTGNNGCFTQYMDPTSSNYVGTDSGNFRVANNIGQDLLNIEQLGVFTFGDGAGGTRMTLNSNGLGVGGVPTGTGPIFLLEGSAGRYARYDSKVGAKTWSTGYRSGTLQYEIQEDGTERFVIANGGNVGIGVTPSAKLHVEGGGAQARFSIASASDARHEYYRNGIREGLIYWDQNLVGLYATQASGEVVIASSNTIRARVKSSGQVRFVPLASDPAGAEAGDVYYNSTSNKLKCYNGTTWNDLF